MYRDPRFYLGILIGVLLAAMWGSFAQTKFVLDKPSTFTMPRGLDIGTGFCKHNGLQDGVWWQPQYGFSGKLSTPCLEAQWNSQGNAGFTFGLAHLGYLHASNLATINDSDPYNEHYTGEPCEHATNRNCRARFDSLASAYGITIGGFWKLGWISLEGGLLGYRSSLDENIERIDANADYPEHVKQHVIGYHVAPYIGAVARYKDLYLRLRAYNGVRQDGFLHNGIEQVASYSDGTAQLGLTRGPVTTLTAGITF